MNISGWAQVSPESAINYSANATEGSLNGSAFQAGSGGIALAGSSMQLTTSLSPGQISFSSDTYIYTGGGAGSGQSSFAEADYTFSLTFNVSSQTGFNLSFPTLQGSGRQHTLDQQFNLSSAKDGVLVSNPSVGPGFSGVFNPGDTYTLSTSEAITADTPDFYGNDWRQDLDFDLTAINLANGVSPVPEPSSSLLFGIAALGMAMIALHRKRVALAAKPALAKPGRMLARR